MWKAFMRFKKKYGSNEIVKIDSVDKMDDKVIIKPYLKYNDISKVYDMEEEPIELAKFLFGTDRIIGYIEIDERFQKMPNNFNPSKWLKELKSQRCYWR